MADRHVLALLHVAHETPGTLADALEARGVTLRPVRTFAGEPVPSELGESEGLIVMGGPQGVYEAERYPFLRDEMRLIEKALAAGTPLIGVCLGSQLLASALGAEVRPGPSKELGWHRVTLTDAGLLDALFKGVESSFTALHWHGDVFSLPYGAVSLASSEKTAHQAFRYGASAYGVLFHLEMTRPMLLEMVRVFADEARRSGVDPDRVVLEADEHLSALLERASGVFEAWASLLRGRTEPAPLL